MNYIINFKHSSKNLIIIYISWFLVLSPLQSQTHNRAKIYLKSGIVVEGSVVKIDEDSIIFRELRDSGEFYEWTVNNSMIFKLISQSGEVLILNHEFEDDFKEGEQRNKKLAIELLSQSKKHGQIRNVSWQISTSNGKTLKAIVVQFIEDDTLKIKFIDSVNISYTKSVALEAVNEIRIKKKTRTSEYSLRFGKIAFWISEIFAAAVYGEVKAAVVFINVPMLFVPPALVLGAIAGAAAGKDDVYKLSGKSDAEKFIIIEKIPNE